MTDRIPVQEILDQMAYADCEICGEPVLTKGRAAHIVCSLARTQATYCVPQAVIVGMAPPRADEGADDGRD